MHPVGNYHFQVGSLQCTVLSDGSEIAPADSVVRGVPLDQWRQALQEHGLSTTETAIYFNNLFIQGRGQRVLVDAGWGQGTQRRDGDLLAHLLAEGISPQDIDTLILTHGDVDHVGGLTTPDNRLVFPNARYILLKEAWDFWSNGPLLAKWPPFLTAFGRTAFPIIRDRIQVVEAGEEFIPGFQLFLAPGHRPGHAYVKMASAGETLFHAADTVGHPILMEHPAWHWYADAADELAQKDKAQVLSLAYGAHALVFGPHLPFPGVGRVAPLGDGWIWQPER
jgi:glyoxylase-like metal-dependent hydrolase (beta-lactamase superfamily II)